MPCVNTSLSKTINTQLYVFHIRSASRARHILQANSDELESLLILLDSGAQRHWPLFYIKHYVDSVSSFCQLCLVTGQEEGLSYRGLLKPLPAILFSTRRCCSASFS